MGTCGALVLGLAVASTRALYRGSEPMPSAFIPAPGLTADMPGLGQAGGHLQRRAALAGLGLSWSGAAASGVWASEQAPVMPSLSDKVGSEEEIAKSIQYLADYDRLVKESKDTEKVWCDFAIVDRLGQYQGAARELFNNKGGRSLLADGVCRIVTGGEPRDGFSLWHQADRAQMVVNEVKKLGPPGKDIVGWVKKTKDQLQPICKIDAQAAPFNDIKVYKAQQTNDIMQSIYKSLCSMTGEDPAEEPWTQAVSVGYICIVVCDSAGMKLPGQSLAKLTSSKKQTQSSVDDLCTAIPWTLDTGASVNFKALDSVDGFAKSSEKWRKVCGCMA